MEQTKNVSFVIGGIDSVSLTDIKGSSKGKFPLERDAIFKQIAEQATKDGTIDKTAKAIIYASVKFNINSVINTLKTQYYGSIEDGAGFVETRKLNKADIPDKYKGIFAEVEKRFTFNRKDDKGKDEKMLFYIVELKPKTE